MEPLKLIAEDKEDLQVMAAYLQDAVGVVGDLSYLPASRIFAGVFNRFRWENAADAKSRKKVFERARTGLHFENVLSVKSRKIAQGKPDGVLNLLSVTFEEGEAPSGTVVLTFSGDGEIRLEVEALEARLRDLGEVWETKNKPVHDAD